MPQSARALTLIATMLALAGCVSTGSFLGGRLVKNLVPIEGDPTTFRNVTYAATDVLADQMQRGGVNAATPIKVQGLKAISLTGTPATAITAYGPAAQQHVTNRLMQHGFRLGGVIPPKATKSKVTAPVTLGGDYILSGQEILMHFEVTEDKSGKMVATHDYTVPMTPEVQAVMAGQDYMPAPALNVAQKWPDMQGQPVYTAPYVAPDSTGGVILPSRKPIL